jgi:hypothetical protein
MGPVEILMDYAPVEIVYLCVKYNYNFEALNVLLRCQLQSMNVDIIDLLKDMSEYKSLYSINHHTINNILNKCYKLPLDKQLFEEILSTCIDRECTICKSLRRNFNSISSISLIEYNISYNIGSHYNIGRKLRIFQNNPQFTKSYLYVQDQYVLMSLLLVYFYIYRVPFPPDMEDQLKIYKQDDNINNIEYAFLESLGYVYNYQNLDCDIYYDYVDKFNEIITYGKYTDEYRNCIMKLLLELYHIGGLDTEACEFSIKHGDYGLFQFRNNFMKLQHLCKI